MDSLLELADHFHNLRKEKENQTEILKEIQKEIDIIESILAEKMTDSECPNFTRKEHQFVLTSTTRWSAETVKKEELYATLKDNGFDHLFSVNAQTLASFIKEQVAETADENGETHVPDWLLGLVKSYDDVGVTMKSTTKKSK